MITTENITKVQLAHVRSVLDAADLYLSQMTPLGRLVWVTISQREQIFLHFAKGSELFSYDFNTAGSLIAKSTQPQPDSEAST